MNLIDPLGLFWNPRDGWSDDEAKAKTSHDHARDMERAAENAANQADAKREAEPQQGQKAEQPKAPTKRTSWRNPMSREPERAQPKAVDGADASNGAPVSNVGDTGAPDSKGETGKRWKRFGVALGTTLATGGLTKLAVVNPGLAVTGITAMGHYARANPKKTAEAIEGFIDLLSPNTPTTKYGYAKGIGKKVLEDKAE